MSTATSALPALPRGAPLSGLLTAGLLAGGFRPTVELLQASMQAMAVARAARGARPASAGGNGLKLAGLSSLPREDPYPPEPGPARDEPASAVPGGMPKLGGGGGGMSKLNLGKISSDHRAEDDGSMSQHERLRIYAKQCSQILPNLYLGADEVAKDLTVR